MWGKGGNKNHNKWLKHRTWIYDDIAVGAFLQHIYRGLLPERRAAAVLPDNVLFEDGQGRSIRLEGEEETEEGAALLE